MAKCKDASRVDAEHVLDDWDKLLHILQVSLWGICRICCGTAVVRVRFPTCRSTDTLHVDGNSEWIGVWVVDPGLLLNGLRLCIVAMEREDDR